MAKRRLFSRWLIGLATLALATSACSFFSDEAAQDPDPVLPGQEEAAVPGGEKSAPADAASFLARLVEQAEQGMIPDSEFSLLRSTIDEVEQRWGKPDKVDSVDGTSYATYEQRGVTFGFAEANRQIVDLRSYDPMLQSITPAMLEEQLGAPDQVREIPDEIVYSYSIGEKIALRFVISAHSGTVDHLSLLAISSESETKTPTPDEQGQENVTRYDLEIKGKSANLTSTAKLNMDRWRSEMRLFANEHRGEMFINGPNQKRVALTFDDGPDLSVTPEIIQILDRHGVKGSFFFIGSKVQARPEVVRQAAASGHLVFGHSYRHEDLTTKSRQEIIEDIRQTEAEIEQITGNKPALLRPPFGETDEEVVEAARQTGNKIVLWSIDTLDWSQKEAENIRKNVMDNVRNGDIILMHSNEDKAETAKALPLIIEELQQQGFEIVGLDQLLGLPAYK